MKFITLLSFILLMSIESFAQQVDDKLFYLGKVEKYRRMKNTGTTLTVVGGVLYIVGIVTIIESYDPYAYNGSSTYTGNPEAGAAAFLLGVAGLGAGIPLWIVGAHNQRKYNSKLEGLSLGFNFSPQRQGLRLTYRF